VLGAAVLVLAAIVLGPSHQDVSSLTGVESLLLGSIGGAARIVFPVLLFVTCLGASLEVCLALSFNVAQGFGWPHALNARHRDAARFRVTMLVVLAGATTVALIVRAPLTLALFASALMALVLPVALFPFLVIMNDPDHLGEYTNGPAANVATLVILLLASVVALCTIPLLIVGGGQ
jgi:Mn2+/Fe2+ NRAMP family transporter